MPSTPAARESLYDYPEYYDILFGWDRIPEALFYDAAFQVHGLDIGMRLLELGCGTGQIGMRLARFGWRMTGLDRQEPMLDYFRKRCEDAGVPAETLCADMTDFRAPVRQDGALCPLGSLGHLPDDAAIVRHFSVLGDALRPGGVYVLDLGFVEGETCEWDYGEVEFELARDGVTVAMRDGIVTVYDNERKQHKRFPWSNRLRQFGWDHFTGLVAESDAFDILALYPEVDQTEDGVSLFDVAQSAPPPATDRAMVILRRR